jgi:hypothetical protein
MPPTKKTSISIDPTLAARALRRAAQLGFQNSFSAYVAKLIREDLERNPPDKTYHPAAHGRAIALNETRESSSTTGPAPPDAPN